MLSGAGSRHLFIETIRNVNFFHYDPYSQLFSKIVRGFRKDLLDAERFLSDGLVDTKRFRSLIDKIPRKAYDKHPELSRDEVTRTVDRFLSKDR